MDSNDAFRHSKWLSFMEKRLRLAKRLLKSDGVLVITIDDDENRHLLMLLEAVFSDRDITSVTIVQNPRGNPSRNLSRTHEYAHFCITKGQSVICRTPRTNSDIRKLRRWGHFSKRIERPTMFYPFYVKEGVITGFGQVPDVDYHPKRNVVTADGSIEVWPIDQNGVERRWNYGLDAVADELSRIVVVTDDAGQIDLFLNEGDAILKTVWTGGEWEAGKHGASLVKALTGVEFSFPKSVYAVKECLAAVTRNRPDALIVDFFAGSGTTLHATCLLNAEDDGRRRCILVTNNEVSADDVRTLHAQGHYKGDAEYERFGIFQRVTRPRCEAAITGNRPDGTPVPGTYIGGRPMADGFAENVSFFRLNYLNPDRVDMGQQFEAIAPLLWLQSGAVGAWSTSDAARRKPGFWLPPSARYGVCFRDSAFAAFCDALHARPDVTHAFLVTNSEDAYTQMRAALPPRLATHRLYRDYLRSFRLKPTS